MSFFVHQNTALACQRSVHVQVDKSLLLLIFSINLIVLPLTLGHSIGFFNNTFHFGCRNHFNNTVTFTDNNRFTCNASVFVSSTNKEHWLLPSFHVHQNNLSRASFAVCFVLEGYLSDYAVCVLSAYAFVRGDAIHRALLLLTGIQVGRQCSVCGLLVKPIFLCSFHTFFQLLGRGLAKCIKVCVYVISNTKCRHSHFSRVCKCLLCLCIFLRCLHAATFCVGANGHSVHFFQLLARE